MTDYTGEGGYYEGKTYREVKLTDQQRIEVLEKQVEALHTAVKHLADSVGYLSSAIKQAPVSLMKFGG